MARSSWILIALVGLAMVGSGMAMLEACPEGYTYAECKSPCGETPEDNPCASDPVNNYCKVSWCKPVELAQDPGMCDYTCTAPLPAMMTRTMVLSMPSEGEVEGGEMPIDPTLMFQTTMIDEPVGGEQPVEYLKDEEGNIIRPIAYNYRGGAATTEEDLPTTPPADGSLEGVDPIIYQTGGVMEETPVYKTPSKKGTKKPKGSKCARGVPMARCLVDPCQYTKCGPDTQCVPNYCGTCSSTCEPLAGGRAPRMGPSSCQAGFYLAKLGKSTTCKKCPAGTYTEEVNDLAKCIACPADTFAPRLGASHCMSCAEGTTSKPGSRRCRRAPAPRRPALRG